MLTWQFMSRTCGFKIIQWGGIHLSKITKVAIECSHNDFCSLAQIIRTKFSDIKEVMFLDTSKGLLQGAEAKIDDLTEDLTPFSDVQCDSLLEE